MAETHSPTGTAHARMKRRRMIPMSSAIDMMLGLSMTPNFLSYDYVTVAFRAHDAHGSAGTNEGAVAHHVDSLVAELRGTTRPQIRDRNPGRAHQLLTNRIRYVSGSAIHRIAEHHARACK